MGNLIITNLEMGLIYSILAIGVFISYKVLRISDLSVEGTFPFGAFLFAKFINLGLNPIASTLLSFLLGTLAGFLTSILFIKLNIEPILAGILTMTILYSVNLNILGSSNISLFDSPNIFINDVSKIIIIFIFVLFIKLIIDLFFKTELGYLVIATGDNESLVKSIGKNSDLFKILGLMISNGLISMSGALMAQYQGFVDITMGQSIIIVALASIIIGDTIFKKINTISSTTKVIIGALIYQIIGGLALELGLDPTYLRAINAIIVIIFISYNKFAPKIFNYKEVNQ